MDNKYKHLMKNTAIFAIGTFGSKVLTFLIVPMYTYVLSTEDYGNVDLFSTAVSLMLPFTTLVIYEAIIRFLIAKEINDKEAISICMVVFLFGMCLTLVGIPFYKFLFNESGFIKYFVICLIINSYNQIFGQYLRAKGKNIAFSFNGIIVTIVTVFSNLIFLLLLKVGVYGYLYSLILAQLFAAVQATLTAKVFQQCSLRCVNFITLKKMLRYSVPLISNNLMWWVMGAGDKYMINYFMGSSANGIYSLAMKIPTVLSMIYSIFMQAWQLSAIEEDQKRGQAFFYTNVFKVTAAVLIICTSLIIITVKPLFMKIIGENFVIAWKYVSFLCIATIISSFSLFAGVIYMVKKESQKAFSTTFLGAFSNLVFNFVLIQFYGLYGIAWGTALGYIVVFYIRAKDAKKAIGMTFDLRRTVIAILTLIVQSIILLHYNEQIFYLAQIVCLLFILWLYRIEILNICTRFKDILKNVKR